ncbi:hypothetical protein [Nisaea sp.]|uniref:hypothetical protein n=1 Tax=Nisaea sp. TaxID=2024842 RepID=UPI003B52F288
MQISLMRGAQTGYRIGRRVETLFALLLKGAGQVIRQLQIGRPGPRVHALPDDQLRDLGLRRDMLVRERRLDD